MKLFPRLKSISYVRVSLETPLQDKVKNEEKDDEA